MTDTREATLRRLMNLVTDGAGLQTKIYAESPEGPILMATAVNYDVAEYMASAVNRDHLWPEAVRIIKALYAAVLIDDDEGLAEHAEPMEAARALISKMEASHAR